MIKHNKRFIQISSISFFVLSFIELIIRRGYTVFPQLTFIIIVGLLSYMMFQSVSTPNHKRIMMAIIAYMINYSLLVLISFIKFPIAFGNLEQIIFTIGFHIAWLISYLIYLHQPKSENSMYIFYIVTVILIMYSVFTDSMRLIAFIRGITDHAITPFETFMLVILVILSILSFYMMMYGYLYRYHKNIKFNKQNKIQL